MCVSYVEAAKAVAQQNDFEEDFEATPEECKSAINRLGSEQIWLIDDCMKLCGDAEGVVNCLDQFGSENFPPCTPDEP